MAMKKYKPTTQGRRTLTIVDKSKLSKKGPEKGLTRGKKRGSGRNNKGRITSHSRGGGHKRRYREIEYRRKKDGVPARVKTIEYDPNRTCHIALLHYADGYKSYILAPVGVNVGDEVLCGDEVEPSVGNCLPLYRIPVGSTIHNIELKPGRGGQMARAAGAMARLMAIEGKFAHIKLPSGELRLISTDCRATIGQVGNVEYSIEKSGTAGRSRRMGKRPHVRGMTKNPVDHPLGGGEGRSKGNHHPVSPTGVPAKGFKTRRKKKYSNKRIVSRRRGRGQ
mgnify:CR=1 FL=1